MAAKKKPKRTPQERWDGMTKGVESTTDLLGLPLDEGIKETVIALNCLGWETSGSCFGHADRPETQGPWVDIFSPELRKLYADFKSLIGDAWKQYQRTGKYPMTPEIKAYRLQSRTTAERLATDIKPLVEKFNETTGHSLVVKPLIDSVRITHTQGLEGKSPDDIGVAQKEMTQFGHYLHNQFLAGAIQPASDAASSHKSK